MATSNKDFRIKNGLIVDGTSATVNGNDVLTSASSINDLSDVTITDPSAGQVIKWNGSAWINDTDATGEGGAGNSFTTIDVPNGTDPVADSATDTLTFADGANITITGDSSTDTVTVAVDADLTGITSILTPNYIGLDLTPTGVPGTQGTLAWNPDQETLDIQLDTNVVLPVGQKHVIRVKNNSGSVAIPKGRVVSFAGATGDTVTVTPAISTSAYEPYLLVGVTAEEIPADGFGFVTQYGFVNNVNTNGFTLGDLLYVDPSSPGVLTNSAPAAPNWTFPVAAVTRVQSSTGRILVRTIPGGHLHDVVDVAISSPANNEILAYNNESGTWINQTSAEAGLVAEGDSRLTDSRTPTAHASSHGLAGADAITIEQSQVTGLTTDLGNKLALAGGTMTGKITLDGDPTQALHAVTKQYVDSVEAGLLTRPQVRAATTANLTADYSNGTAGVGATLTSTSNGAFPLIDDVALTTVNGARGLLVKSQTNAAHNGRYNLTTQGDAGTPWVLTRCGLCDEADEIPGSYVFVTDGTINGQTGWVQHVDDPATFVVGTDDIDVFQFSGAGTITAGTNTSVSGNQISVVDSPSLSSVRLTTTTDASLSSTGHAFQVGSTSSTNLIIDNNEILARNNSGNSNLSLNAKGGSVTIGDSGSTVTVNGTFVAPVSSATQTALNLKANLDSPTFTGTPTAPLLRLTSITNATTTSTGHGLQIGPTTGVNLRLDNNEVTALNNGAVSTLLLNPLGGDITLGHSSSAITIPGDIVSPTYTGDATGNRIRLTTTTDASLSSTGHAFQIGASNSTNLIMDGNEIMARNDGAASSIFINGDGGTVDVGGSTGSFVNERAYSTSNDWAALGRTRKSAWLDSNGTLGNAASSSREVKQQINPTSYEYDKIISIEPKTFKYNEAVEIMGENAPLELGFIAEDLHDAGLTELVYYKEDGSVEGLDYTKFAVVTQQIVREQHRMIMELKDEIEELKSRL